jgi:hypothetical protein
MMKGRFIGVSVFNEAYKFRISSFPVATKQTNIAYTRDNTIRMISEIVCTEKNEGGLRKDQIKGHKADKHSK